ncbi:MAG TPA: AAA family ATPase [Alphaproteobacteria bacterium]|nr:AAA family ATPase [Alphaproteobacteria bacterium]
MRLPFLDFSTLAARRAACERELALNRRTAPEHYLALRRVTRNAGSGLAIDGAGETVDWLVEMRRFADGALLDEVARRGGFGVGLALRLADQIAAFHAASERFIDRGGGDAMAGIAAMNVDCIDEFAPAVFDPDAAAALRRDTEAALARQRGLLDRRMAEGRVRHCHGDLHLHNIFLDGDTPRLFDAIEFDDRLAQIDVMYDLAFLLMDLWHRDLKAEAARLLSRYLLRSGDFEGLAALPLFLSLRAGIRAHVTARMADGEDGPAALHGEARSYLALARDLLRPRRALLVGVGGLSGSGKSTFANALAPWLGRPPGAICLRSDELRKQLMGVEPEAPLPADAYAAAVSRRVYDEMRRRAGLVLAQGYAAIADAVQNRSQDRAALAVVADKAGTGFAGFWLEADEATLLARVGGRSGDASDADAAVVRKQLSQDAGTMDWHRLDAEREVAALVEAALAVLPGETVNRG